MFTTGGGGPPRAGGRHALRKKICQAAATGRRINKLKSVVEEIKKKGGSAVSEVIDVQDETSIKN